MGTALALLSAIALQVSPECGKGLRWQLSDQGPGDQPATARVRVEALWSMTPDGEPRWRRPAPAWLKGLVLTAKTTDLALLDEKPCAPAAIRGGVLNGIETGGALVFLGSMGIWALSKATGEVLVDRRTAATADSPSLSFGPGLFRVFEKDRLVCSGTMRGGELLAECADVGVVAFDGFEAILLARGAARVLAATGYDRERQRLRTDPSRAGARIPLGKLVLEVEGAVFVR